MLKVQSHIEINWATLTIIWLGIFRSRMQSLTPVLGRMTPSKIEALSDPNSLSEVLGMVPPEFLEENLSARLVLDGVVSAVLNLVL